MSTDDPYAVLGLAPDATAAEVGRAYRREVRRHHPDTAGPEVGEDARRRGLRRVQAAYDLLRDPRRRADYDRLHPGSPRAAPPPSRPRVTVTVTPAGSREPPLRAGPVCWVRPGR